jgi:DNA repair protein RadC
MKTVQSHYTIADTDLVLDAEPVQPVFPIGKSSLKERRYILKVRDLPAKDKPREKLLALGPAALSVPELLATVLGTGSQKEDVLAMSARIIKEYGERVLSRQTNAAQLAQDLKIPLLKALQVVACAELGRRFFAENPSAAPVIRTPHDVFEYLKDMRDLPREHMRGMYLNAHHKIIHDEVISIGTVNSSIIHPREVFKPAIEYGAAAVILAHNHPSGEIIPSQADIEVTKQLIAAGKLIGIHLIDHVIIGKDSFMSIDVEYG